MTPIGSSQPAAVVAERDALSEARSGRRSGPAPTRSPRCRRDPLGSSPPRGRIGAAASVCRRRRRCPGRSTHRRTLPCITVQPPARGRRSRRRRSACGRDRATAAPRDRCLLRRDRASAAHGSGCESRQVAARTPGVNRTGISEMPVSARGGGVSVASSRSGRRASSRSKIACSSRRARLAPRQKCAPNPNARCSFGDRSMSNRLGLVELRFVEVRRLVEQQHLVAGAGVAARRTRRRL